MPRLTKKRLVGGALLAFALLVAPGGFWVWSETRPKEKLGSPTVEFKPADEPEARAVARPNEVVKKEPWPTYGFGPERAHVSPFGHRPPFKRLWVRTARHFLEYPPVIAYGRIFLPQQKGRFFTVNPHTGGILWSKSFRRCAPSSPTVADGVVYQALMHPLPCRKHQPGATGALVAMHPLNGKEFWRFRAGAIESSPVVVDNRIYFGSWDRNVYALDAKTGKQIWEYRTDERVVAAPAYSGRTVYVGTNGGRLYAIYARTGKLRWRASSFTRLGRREYFYATPAVAYGRVYAPNTDWMVYAYGAKYVRLLRALRAGTDDN